MKATITKIIPFSSVDGPGNRTAVFLQGCNIDCKYCHNPETRKHCISCGVCVAKCPAGALAMEMGKVIFKPEKCVQCDTCIHVCPNDSTPRTTEMTPEEVYAKVKKQVPFIRGLTTSGGECMLRPDFLTALFRLAKKDNLNTMIDSNGTILFEQYPELLEVTDGVMLDIKAFDSEEHRTVTGVTNEAVLQNAKYLAERGKLFEVRAVIVPELYNTEESVRSIGEFLAPYLEINDIQIKVIAYRPMGVREQYANYAVPEPGHLQYLANILKEYGFKNIIII